MELKSPAQNLTQAYEGIAVREQIKTLIELCHRYGTSTYVNCGGGNISWKDGDILWIKASGTYLSQASEETLVAVRRQPLQTLYQATVPEDANERETWAKWIIQQAVAADMAASRPSVETPLHGLFEANFVVHTHPTIVNGLSCARDAEAACQLLFPDAMWVPYVDPGVTLCLLVKRQFEEYIQRHGREPFVIIMQNHGLIVAADTLDEIHALHKKVFGVLEDAYRAAGLDTSSPACRKESGIDALPDDFIRSSEHEQIIMKCPGLKPAPAPLTPDHIVYSGVAPLSLDDGQSLSSYRQHFRSEPRLVIHKEIAYTLGATDSQAQAACDLAADGAHVLRLTEAFGGARFMSEDQWRFVVNWEAEAYRQAVNVGS